MNVVALPYISKKSSSNALSDSMCNKVETYDILFVILIILLTVLTLLVLIKDKDRY